jgi:proline racemase
VVGGETRHAVAIRPGKIDRSPTGTGVSAHLALMRARGDADIGTTLTARSIIDSEFTGRIEGLAQVGNVPAIVPSLTGRAWIYGRSELLRAPDDPWPEGYRVADTWPGA